jgi:hypothetical protein
MLASQPLLDSCSKLRVAIEAPREVLISEQAQNVAQVIPEGTDLVIWTWEMAGKYWAKAFAGKSKKPIWYWAFSSPAGRNRQIEESAVSRRVVLKHKQDQLDARKNYKHPYKEGSILYSSWGYDQTNVDFYQVTKISGAVITVRPIKSDILDSPGGSRDDRVVALPNAFSGPEIRLRPTSSGVSIKGHRASLWDGRPVYQTAFGYGH